ncbi:MAG: M3 family oligoendopeptidase [Ignavibacteria bacterium]|nr:M3 family oligoendopeptidase [Ignavibacteria bacterium]
MKFSEMKYARPDIDEVSKNFRDLIKKFKESLSLDEADRCLDEINNLRNHFYTMKVIAFINYTIDTENKNFEAEQDYFDETEPVFNDIETEYYRELVNSKFREELSRKYGKHLFEIAEIFLKSISHEIVEELKKENHLKSEYLKLKASAKVDFMGSEKNLQELLPYMESKDQEIRHKAVNLYWGFFADNTKELDIIFDKLVKLRNEMAVKMGYKNFIELGYARMMRMDYDEKMVWDFRENVKKYLVPLSIKLRDRQKKRLGLDKLLFHDSSIKFKSGNAVPKGNPEWIMEEGKKMYDELSPETREFIDFMMENELFDVFSKKGKADMGYCDYISDHKSPYIFANMNGTEDDITVLTHEAGHAFQSYCSRDFHFREYSNPTMETAEIHSMSMEFLTYPWMNLFFKEDTDKFKFSHISECIKFIPYGVLVDHFQHWVYENPSVTPLERKNRWRELEKIYIPDLKFGDIEFLEKGGRWQKQGHIFESPFYYIDYCLAQMCAFQFWSKAIHNGNENFENSVHEYIDLCKKGGSDTFLKLAESANLQSPFSEDLFRELSKELEEYTDSVNDREF